MAENEARPKRERKQVEPFKPQAVTEKKQLDIGDGNGVILGDYDFFVKSMEKLKSDNETISSIHQLLYGSLGTKNDRKKNIKKFNGYSADAISKLDNTKVKLSENKKKWTVSVLKDCAGLFGIEKNGSREELITRVVEFCAKPYRAKSDKAAISGKKRKSTGKVGKTKKSKKAHKIKKAPSAYMLFVKHIRSEVVTENPDSSFGEIGKILGDKWNNLNDNEKEVNISKLFCIFTSQH